MESQVKDRVQENQQQTQQVETDSDQNGQVPGKKKKKPFLRILIFLVVLALLGGGIWFLLSSPEGASDSSTQRNTLNKPETNVDNTEPTPTSVTIETDKAEIKIELLNGTGIAGEATLVKEELEELGYEDIEVGNADNQDYEETSVTFSNELSGDFIEEFLSQLEDIYTKVNSSTSSNLGGFDVRIIAGMRSAYTPAPTKTPEPTLTPTLKAETTGTPTPTVSPTPTPQN